MNEYLLRDEDNHAWFARADRFDGFDRGDNASEPETTERVIGRKRCWHGTVEVVEVDFGLSGTEWYVRVEGRVVTPFYKDRADAIRVGHWWLAGCPA